MFFNILGTPVHSCQQVATFWHALLVNKQHNKTLIMFPLLTTMVLLHQCAKSKRSSVEFSLEILCV